jgi:hypothetical protein
MSKTLLTDEIIKQKLEDDGIMEEPDATWLLEYIKENYCGSLDTTTDWNDSNHMLKIYSEMTSDGYDIYWCTFDEKPYVSQDGYYYTDHSEWSDQAINELVSGSDVWIEPHLWDDMEWEFNHALEAWWQDVYEEKEGEMKDELLDSGEYYEEEEE